MSSKRAIWSGSLSIGLINLPIKLYGLVREDRISFNNLCGKCGTKISMKRFCLNCGEEVDYGSMKKGFALNRNQIIEIDKEDIDNLKLKSEKVIEIKGFVPIANIDNIFYNNTKYYVIPSNSNRAYELLEKVLSLKGLMGVGKLTLRSREIIIGLRSYKGFLVVVGLNYFKELEELPKDLYEVKNMEVDKNQLELCLAIFDKMGIEFETLKEERDRYTESLEQLVKAKAENKEFKLVEEIAKPTEEDLNTKLEKMLAIEVKKKDKKE